jgi:hypothetical protein
MEGKDAEAIDEGAHAVVLGEPMEKDGAGYGKPIGDVSHGVGHQQGEAVVDRGPQEEEGGEKDGGCGEE